MKGLSILLTLALLVLAQELATYLRRSGLQHSSSNPDFSSLMQQPDLQLQARTNTRGLVPKRVPAFRAEGKFRGFSREPYPEPPNTIFEL